MKDKGKPMDLKNEKIKKALTVLSLLIIILLKLFTAGYNFGTGNQGETIPIHMRLEDNQYLVNDSFVDGQAEYNVRSNFSYLMFATKVVTLDRIGYEEVYLGWFTLLLALIVVGGYKVISELTDSMLIRLGVLILFALGPNTSIGVVNIMGSQLLPGTFSSVAIVWALYALISKKYRLMIGLVLIALYFHLLIGLLAGVAFVGAYFIMNFKEDRKSLMINIAILVVIALPAVIPHMISSGSSFGEEAMRVTEIIAFFRNPHHYSPSTWEPFPIVVFFILQICATFLLYRCEKDWYKRRLLLIILLIINLMYLVGYIFVDVWTVPIIAKFQMFRISIIGDLLNKVLIGVYLPTLLIVLFENKNLLGKKVVFMFNSAVILVAILLSFHTLVKFNPKIEYKFHQPPQYKIAAFSWIAANTPEHSLFITPIGESDFRLTPERAMVVNFKQFVFKDEQVLDWYDRIKDLCGFEEPSCIGWECPTDCKKKYEIYNEEDFLLLDEKYNADYILTSSSHTLDFEIVYRDQTYTVYKLK